MTANPTGRMDPPAETRPTTRKLAEPDRLLKRTPVHMPSGMAARLAECHNTTLRRFGSDSGGKHAFDPARLESAGVWDGSGGFPDGTVISDLAWGRMTATFAQRLLEYDGVETYAS